VRQWVYILASMPANLGTCTAVAAGQDHLAAINLSGYVRVWGSSSNVPSDLGKCTAIAAGYGFTVALQTDGGVRVWSNGISEATQTAQVPASLMTCTAVAAGSFNVIVVAADGYSLLPASNAALTTANTALTSQNAALTAQLNCGDLNGDGKVNGADVGLQLVNYGPCAPPEAAPEVAPQIKGARKESPR